MRIFAEIFSFLLIISKVNQSSSEVKALVACDGLPWPFYFKLVTVLQCMSKVQVWPPHWWTSECSSNLQFPRGLHTDGELVWPNARFPIGMAWPRTLELLGVNREATVHTITGTHLDSVHTTGSHALTAQRQSLKIQTLSECL